MLFIIFVIYLGLTAVSLVTSVVTNIYIDNTYTRPGMGTDGHFVPWLNKWSTDIAGFFLMPVYIPYRILHYVFFNFDKIIQTIVDGLETVVVWLGRALKNLWLNVIVPVFKWIRTQFIELLARVIWHFVTLLEFIWEQILVRIYNGIKTLLQYLGDAIKFVWTNVIVRFCYAFCDVLNYIWTNVIVRAFRFLCDGLEKLMTWLIDGLAEFFRFLARIFTDYVYPFIKYFFTQLYEGIKYVWFNILIPFFQTIGNWI